MQTHHQLVFAVLILSFALVAGCDNPLEVLVNPMDRAIAELDEGIFRLDTANADWQRILTETRDTLTDEAQSTVRNEVNDVLMRGIAASGGEFRCDVDFLRQRTRQDLIRIRARLKGETVDPAAPYHCSITPDSIRMALDPAQRDKLNIYGWDFSEGLKPSLTLVYTTGATTDVSQYLHVISHYMMVVNLAANGVPLTNLGDKLILKYEDGGTFEIPIQQPQLPTCKIESRFIAPQNIGPYIPPNTRGDSEYDGSGPHVTCTVNIINHGSKLVARVYMKAMETESDWTTAEGTKDFDIYYARSGYIITKVTPNQDDLTYLDSDHANDLFGGSGLVRTWTFVGDTKGDEAGTVTGVTIGFNQIQITERQTAGCI